MYLLVVDRQAILSRQQLRNARNRLFYSLARFGHRINRVAMDFAEERGTVRCSIEVMVEGSGTLHGAASSHSFESAMNLAINLIEPKVAWRVAWRSWLNAETFATWKNSAGLTLNWLTRRGVRRRAKLNGVVVKAGG